jgi:hypothetical protein
LIGGFNLTGDGNYARNLFIVLICARPPRRVFILGFGGAILHPIKPQVCRPLALASRAFEGQGRLQIVGLCGMSNPENALFRVRSPAAGHLPVEACACFR